MKPNSPNPSPTLSQPAAKPVATTLPGVPGVPTSPSPLPGAGASKSKPPEPKRFFPRPRQPVLRFTPYAWAKLQWFCFCGDTEIGGFGVAADPQQPLLISDFVTVAQKVTAASVSFDDTAVGDFFEDQVDAGLKPQQFARLWLHTHPGDSPTPSSTDEDTFQRVFGSCDWAVMFVLARGGKTYARLRFNIGPGGQSMVPVEVDYSVPFPASDFQGWQAEYDAHIQPELLFGAIPGTGAGSGWESDDFVAWSNRRNQELDLPRGEAELLDDQEWLAEELDALDEALWDSR